jgi:hypothetical protein
VNLDSQLLVFSKTSVQAARISPDRPRAIYFADDVAVGYVPGSANLELAAIDLVQGPVFYAVSVNGAGRGRFNPADYLAETSDIVALMTFEHQTQMTNLITRVGWQARMARHAAASEVPAGAALEREIEELVAYMLFSDEARLREPVEGVSTFTQTFPRRGPRDKKGRSLRDFDLRTRLFRYPLSYMIYSEAFEALPASVRQRIYDRLDEVLTGKERGSKYAHLSRADRLAIREILQDTKPAAVSRRAAYAPRRGQRAAYAPRSGQRAAYAPRSGAKKVSSAAKRSPGSCRSQRLEVELRC